MNTIFNFFILGGPFMYPLLLCSVIAISLILERMVTSYFWTKKVNEYVIYIKSRGSKGLRPPGLSMDFWSQDLLTRKKYTEEDFQNICEDRIRSHQILSTIGSISPLLGFIGTISGMINSFQSIANADKVSIKLVATGISEALITTGFGLIIAVFCSFSEALGMFLFRGFTQKTAQHLETIYRNEP